MVCVLMCVATFNLQRTFTRCQVCHVYMCIMDIFKIVCNDMMCTKLNNFCMF
jgi:hypothetical protein